MSESSLLSGDIPPASPSHDEKFTDLDYDEDSLVASDAPSQFTTVLTRSGASARFHSSQPVRIRLLIRASALPSSPAQVPADFSYNQSGAFECTITQHSTLHSVEFSLEVAISFLTQRPERPESSANAHAPPVQEYAKVSIPITLLPPPARKGDQTTELDMEQAYHKKFDKPPVKTNRVADADVGPPGPSASGAPPPFDERDAPPPPFVQSDPQSMQAGTSRLPTFLESEAHYVVPLPGPSSTLQTPYGGYVPIEGSSNAPQPNQAEEDPDRLLELEGEGRLFGFRPEQQFDGLEASFGGAAEPPPAIENVQEDTDVTALADLVDRPERALEAIGRGMSVASAVDPGGYASHREDDMDNLEHALRLDAVEGPAPPFVDDPADPPPGIDMEFRTSPPPFPPPSADQPPLINGQAADLPPPPIEDEPLPRPEIIENPSVRPPPYLTTTDAPSDSQHGPPPSYVDLRPSS